MRILLIAIPTALVLLIGACQSTSATSSGANSGSKSNGIDRAVLAPAEDLNLRRTEIPPTLKALEAAYLDGKEMSCETIAAEVIALTAELGLDEDELRHQAGASRAEKAGKAASEAALDAVEGVTTGFIPFRGVVRYVSGAAEHERKLRAATLTGLKRRAFLKGLGAAKGCAPPAAPLPPPPPEAGSD